MNTIRSRSAGTRWFDTLLAWYFVVVWGSGYLATKTGIHYAAPFTFLALRFTVALICLGVIVAIVRPPWPRSPSQIGHLIVAGLLMHAANLGGSHYAQYLGLSAGVTAVILALQPLATALIAARWMRQPLVGAQWLGVFLGFAGVALIVWHKIDVREITVGALVAVTVSLVAMTAGTLYQRVFCPTANLWTGAVIQFAASLAVLAPLAVSVEGFVIVWSWPLAGAVAFLVIFASILAVNALHTLMRHGEAARVTSLLYLTPIFAVALEYLMFDVVPSALSALGIAITCAGVALVALVQPSRRSRG